MKNAVMQETKAQRWRALAIMEDGSESLIVLGISMSSVRESYATAFFDLFEPKVRSGVDEIALQKWAGAPDRGEWVTQTVLSIPFQKAA